MTAPSAARGIAPTGYRLPDATRLGPVRLQVADLARSLSYYERVLGLRVVRRDQTSATLAPLEGEAIVELREKAGVNPVPRRGRLGLYHYAILLPTRASLGAFATHLASIGVRAGASDHRVSEAFYLQDPDGLGIEVYADRPRAAWRYEGPQLTMDTTPLDIQSLVREAKDTPWEGMPAGTVIGHVHLHVGDLEEAERFYHGALGFDKVVWNYPGALFLSAGGYHHHLGTNTWAAGAASAAEDDAKLLQWTIVVPRALDAAHAAKSLESAGYGIAPEGGGTGFSVQDPWGTTLRVVSAE